MDKRSNEQGINTNMHMIMRGTKHNNIVIKDLVLGHFDFAH